MKKLIVEYRSEDSPKEALNAAFGVLADDFERVCETERFKYWEKKVEEILDK